MDKSLHNFFYPKSVCVAGASTKEKSIGYELLKTIKTYEFKGEVYPVNPKADEVLGYKCYHSISDIKKDIDLAIIAVPKKFAEETLDILLERGVKSIILITAGFKETGEEGKEIEARFVSKVRDAGARLLGPNCMGVISTLDTIKLNATFVAEKPETGKTAFLSQSGALGAAVLNSLRDTDIKFAHFISVGNKADINENTFLQYWQNDENINSLSFYLESFENGEEFIYNYFSSKLTKPSIVLKAGKTSGGMKAASSHTGALGSADKVVQALLRQFGVIRADNLNELFNTVKGFENFPAANGNRVAVVTNAGGPAILAVDSLEKEGLVLAEFTDSTKDKLREVVHPEGSVNNPVDLLPGGNADAYKAVNEIVAMDDNVDAVISIFVEPVMVQPLPVVEAVYSIKSDKPIMQAVMPLPEFWQEYRENSEQKLPIFRNPEDPAEVISNMLFFTQVQNKLKQNRDEYLKLYTTPAKSYLNNFTGYLPHNEMEDIAEKYNFPIVKQYLIKASGLITFDHDIFPVVLKGINKNVVHKSELDAVKLNIRDKAELFQKANDIENGFSIAGIHVEEYLIQPFIRTKYEVLLGGFRDPSFGPVIMFGTGGKYVEVYKDICMKSAYLTDEDIEDMINMTSMGKLLKGVRGEEVIDITRLKEVIKSAALMLIENPEITEFDFNPLIISPDNLLHAVDIRINVK